MKSVKCSLDSDDDFFYSSPDDEEEFMSREFLKDYDSARSDRLVAMGKGELINEYLQMEARIDSLEKRLQRSSKRKDAAAAVPNPPADPDSTERISVFQREIHALEAENAALREETRALREQRQAEAEAEAVVVTEDANGRVVDDAEAVVSSSSSDDEGSSSDSGSSSDEESDDEEENAAVNVDAEVEPRFEQGDNNHGDTGYESQRDEEETGAEEGRGSDVTSSTTSL